MDPPVPLAVAREWHARLAGNALSRRYMAVRTRPPKQVPESCLIGVATSSRPDGIRCGILFACPAVAGSAPRRSSVMEEGKELWPLVGERDRVRQIGRAHV